MFYCLAKDDGVKALVLSPTRELALQIDEELRRIGKYTSLSIVSVFGGSEIEKQIRSLKKGADIVCFSGDKLLGGPQALLLEHLDAF